MLEFLYVSSSKAETLSKRILELWIALHKNNYIVLESAEGIREWMNVLNIIDYEFPSVDKDSVAGMVVSVLNSQPMEEGQQPYRLCPYFDNNRKGCWQKVGAEDLF